MFDDNSIFSTYSLDSPYWLIFEGAPLEPMMDAKAVSLYRQPNLMGVCVPSGWPKAWDKITSTFGELPPNIVVRAAVIPAETTPSLQEIQLSLKPLKEINAIAHNIWLARYLSEGRLVSFMQPVVDRDGNIVGYEAFARIDAPDREIISGGAIIEASHALRLEYQVDRLLQKHCVQKFMSLELDGTLFINFLSHFIHSPATYFTGLLESMDRYNVAGKQIALDVPFTGKQQDAAKLQSIASFCREHKINVALDDVHDMQGLPEMLAVTRPQYLKLDAALSKVITESKTQALVQKIIECAHGFGTKIIAEAVEHAEQYEQYKTLNVDFFQGYHFAAPLRNPPKKL